MPVDQVFEREFLKGQQLCVAGKDCPSDASEFVTQGFNTQYAAEQQLTELSRQKEAGHYGLNQA